MGQKKWAGWKRRATSFRRFRGNKRAAKVQEREGSDSTPGCPWVGVLKGKKGPDKKRDTIQ